MLLCPPPPPEGVDEVGWVGSSRAGRFLRISRIFAGSHIMQNEFRRYVCSYVDIMQTQTERIQHFCFLFVLAWVWSCLVESCLSRTDVLADKKYIPLKTMTQLIFQPILPTIYLSYTSVKARRLIGSFLIMTVAVSEFGIRKASTRVSNRYRQYLAPINIFRSSVITIIRFTRLNSLRQFYHRLMVMTFQIRHFKKESKREG